MEAIKENILKNIFLMFELKYSCILIPATCLDLNAVAGKDKHLCFNSHAVAF